MEKATIMSMVLFINKFSSTGKPTSVGRYPLGYLLINNNGIHSKLQNVRKLKNVGTFNIKYGKLRHMHYIR